MSPWYLIALFVQALLYGLYLATLVHCFRWLVYADGGWEIREKINWPMLIITILIFLLCTIDVGLRLQYEIHYMGYKTWGIVEELLTGLSEAAVILIVDAVLIYRCWIIYAKSRSVICMPLLFWFGSLTSIALIFYYDAIFTVDTAASSYSQSMLSFTSLCFCDIGTNVYATSAIIYRILSVAKASGRKPGHLYNLIRILAESGLMFTSTAISVLVGAVLEVNNRTEVNGPVLVITEAISFSMACITFNLILIRVNQNRVHFTDTTVDTQDVEEKYMVSGSQISPERHATRSQSFETSKLPVFSTKEIQAAASQSNTCSEA